MKVPIKIDVDYTLDNFELRTWHKNVGDTVKAGDPVLDYETQKVALEVSAPASGVLCEITVAAGEQVFRPDSTPTGAWSAIAGFIDTGAA